MTKKGILKPSMQQAVAEKAPFPWMPHLVAAVAVLPGFFALHRARALIWAPVAFSIGIFAYFSLQFEPPVFWGPVCAAIVFALWVLVWPQKDESALGRGGWLLVGAVFLAAAGFGAAQLRTAMVHTPILFKALGPVDVIGTIESLEKLEGGSGSRAVLSHLEIEKLAPDKTPRKIRLHIRKDEGLQSGMRVSMLARLNPPSPPVTPGAFDFQRYAFFRGLGSVGFAYSAPEILQKSEGTRFWGAAEALQNTVVGRIEKAMEGRGSALAMALIAGERTAISQEDTEAMRASGLAHLLAISGLHVGMVAGIIFFLSRLVMALSPWAALHLPIKKIAAVLALAGAFFYMCLVGAPVPTQRAMMMTGIALVAIMLDRSPFSLRLVAIAAFAVLLFAPESLLSVSFQMSFAAVTMLIWFYDSIRGALQRWYRGARFGRKAALYFVGIAMTTVIASIATAPFALYHFQRFALYGVLANLLAVPMMAFIVMPAGVFAMLLMPLGLEALPLTVMGAGVSWILEIAHSTAALEGSNILVAAWPPISLFLIVAGTLILMLFRGPVRGASVACFALSLLFISIYKQPSIQISSSNKLIAVNGQNDALLLSSKRADRYTAENWLRRNGEDEEGGQLWPKEGDEGGFTCGQAGCRWNVKGHKVAFSLSPQAQAEDCAWAELLIAQNPMRTKACKALRTIDFFDVYYGGAQAIWLKEGRAPIIKTDRQIRGARPWTPYSP